VTIEGPEGAGKTTQAERLRRAASDAGLDTILTREPGGTVVGERVRALVLDPSAVHDPRTDALLFNAARAQLVDEVVRPGLDRGALVISTRFADSTLAYQGYGAGIPLDQLRAVEAVATRGLRPDLTILLDVPPEIGLGRKAAELTRFETAFGLEFHRRVRDGFLALAAAEPGRFEVVDASDDEAGVSARVLRAAGRLEGLEAIAKGAWIRGEPERVRLRIHQ
jgi:dTMP kinase